MEQLKGPFKDIIPNFIMYKQSLGHKYNNIQKFNKLDQTLYEHGIKNFKDTKIIYEILVSNETNTKVKSSNYVSLSQLYSFMKILGYKNLYLKPLYIPTRNKYKAKILSNKEIIEFFKVLDAYVVKENEFKMLSVLFRLVYSNGLRISEVLNLRLSDFSQDNRTIFIRKSKENIDRLLPLSDSMFDILHQYLENNRTKTYVFEIDGKQIKYSVISRHFNKVKELLKFNFRIHDLRHTFAVNNFNHLFDLGYKETWILYYLHIYLGHQTLKSTEYYLQLTPKRFKQAIKKTDVVNANLFPKVGDYNE